jgi:hypothetical protein
LFQFNPKDEYVFGPKDRAKAGKFCLYLLKAMHDKLPEFEDNREQNSRLVLALYYEIEKAVKNPKQTNARVGLQGISDFLAAATKTNLDDLILAGQ